MFEKDNQIVVERSDDHDVIAGALERYLSQHAVESVMRERDGTYDNSWHLTPSLVHEKQLLQDPDNIPWDEDDRFELSATPELLIAGLNLALAKRQPEIFDPLSPEQQATARQYLQELKGLKAEDSFTWQASRAEQ